MSEQPPGQPPNQPTQGNPPTQPMPASGAPTAGPSAPNAGPTGSAAGPPAPPVGPPAPPAGPPAGSASPDAPKPNMWHRATATTGRSIALAVAAGALVVLLFLGFAIASVALLHHNDRIDLLGQREDRKSLRDDGPGNGKGNGKGQGNGKGLREGQGPGAEKLKERVLPGPPGGRGQGLGGLGSFMGGSLHGTVSATVDGSVQALLFQRGEITAVSATSITLKSTDGFVGTYGRNADTKANGAAPVKGGQAFVLARASDKVALRTIATPAKVGVTPSS